MTNTLFNMQRDIETLINNEIARIEDLPMYFNTRKGLLDKWVRYKKTVAELIQEARAKELLSQTFFDSELGE